MESLVIQVIGRLQRELEKRVTELQEANQEEESKEQAQVQKILSTVRKTLHSIVDKAVDIVEDEVDELLDPFSYVGDKIDEIDRKLRNYSQIWKNKDADLTEQAIAVAEIGKIENEIKALKLKEVGGFNPDEMIEFDSHEILMALVELIRAKEDRNEKREEALLSIDGYRFEIKTGKKEKIKFDRNIPQNCATFPINKKFYVCGGKAWIDGKPERIADFFSLDYFGKSEDLQPMNHKRSSLSLSGLPSQLIALGGHNEGSLKICEKYEVSLQKWEELPSLNTGRQRPGSILLKSKRAFCFCGGNDMYTDLNSIESLEIEKETQWKTLTLNYQIAQTYHFAGVEFKNKIVVFGGHSYTSSYSAFIFSKEGELEQDLSQDSLTPEDMCQGSFTVQGGKIYAVGFSEVSSEWAMRVFDGKKWS